MTVYSEQLTGRRKTVGLFLLALFTVHCSLFTYAAATLEEQAQAAWQSRDQPGQTEAAIRLFRQAAEREPNNAELWIKLSKAQGRAVRHATTTQEKRKWADEARSSADRAIRLGPNNAEAYTVYGEALGQWANAHKGIHSLRAVRRAVAALQKAITIDPKHAYAHMLLAEFYRQSPGVISIGDKEKALEHARLAVEYGPGYAINHLVLARALLDTGNKDAGIAELQKILSLSPPDDAIPETRADQETAQSMLKSMDINPGPPPACGDAGNACVGQP